MHVPPRRIALIGLSGAGKTRVGALAAALLQWPFFDTDRLVEKDRGKSIPALFAEDGEAAFRSLESRILARLARRKPPLVVSLGGGAVLREENLKLLEESFYVVWIQVDPREAARRLAGGERRPLLVQGNLEGALRTQEREREPYYQKAANARVLSPAGASPETVAQNLTASLADPSGSVDGPWTL